MDVSETTQPAAMSSTIVTTTATSSDNILVILGITTFISLTMLRVVSKSFISFVGIVFNLDLVYITFGTRSLHGTCNLLIALNALFTAIFEFSYITELIIASAKLSPVPLSHCFWLQLFPLFGANCTIIFILFIGIDRLLSTAFPTWHSGINTRFYLTTIIGLCFLYSLTMAVITFIVAFERYPDLGLGCQVADLYRDEAKSMIQRNNIILNLTTLGCYICVWILIKRTKSEVSTRLFKSLTAIMLSVFGGWFLYSIATIVIDQFNIAGGPRWYILFSAGLLQSIADASHAPILYAFRMDLNATSVIQTAVMSTTVITTTVSIVDNQSNNFLVVLGITNLISLTMLRVVSKSFVSFVGIVFNLDLVYVTFRTRSLHGTCNLLIALNALFTAFFEFSYITELIIASAKLNPVPLSHCFWLQLFPLFGANCTIIFILFIGIDRLLSTAFPTCTNRVTDTYSPKGYIRGYWSGFVDQGNMHGRINTRYYLTTIIGLCFLYSSIMAFCTFLVVFQRYPDLGLGCQVSDLYRDEAKSMIERSNIILNLTTFCCYIGVWILIKRTKGDVSTRLFKSLTAIMLSVFGGWFLYSIATIVIDKFEIIAAPRWYILFSAGLLQSIADASHAPILYAFSSPYRSAFRYQFSRIKATVCRRHKETNTSILFLGASKLLQNNSKSHSLDHSSARHHHDKF